MGLAIVVGVLAEFPDPEGEGASIRRIIADANLVLERRRLPRFAEPERIRDRSRAASDGFPYTFLHYLRRAFALCREQPGASLAPVVEGDLEADAPIVERVTHRFDSHLLCHSDSDGIYVPVDFPKPLFCDPQERIPGGLLGSSHGLFRELAEVGPALGVRLEPDRGLADEEAARINSLVAAQGTPHWIELTVWLALYEAARISTTQGCAIVFD